VPIVSLAWAQTYPSRPVRIIVGFAAGGHADILARLMGQWLSDRLGQSFVVENRTGGGGNIGTEASRYSRFTIAAVQRDPEPHFASPKSLL